MRIRFAAAILLCLGAAACGARSDTEHMMFQWAEALNAHLAGDFEAGNEYPHALADIDPMMRLGRSFEDGWGNPFYYRRINDGRYDLVSSGPDGELGNDDDVCLTNAVLMKPASFYEQRPVDKRLRPQGESGALG